jgi:VWFA-related protein
MPSLHHFFLVTLSGLVLIAQQPAPHHLLLDVAVTDNSGRLIPGLQQEDFSLTDNKQSQPLAGFRATQGDPPETPLEILFVIDEVNTGFQTVARARDQMHEFFARDAARLARPASIAFFSDKGVAVGNAPTTDGNTLIAQMDEHEHALRVGRRAQGAYGAMERLQTSIHALQVIAQYESKRPGRKLVVWISPGWALLSGPRIELTNKNEEAVFHLAVEISGELRQSRITLYSIDPLGMADAGGLRTTYYKTFLKPVNKPNQVQLGNLALQVLATQSGGLALNSSNDIAGEIAHCVADAGTYYQLTYDPPSAGDSTDFHQIEIKLDKPGITARTRNGYYPQP